MEKCIAVVRITCSARAILLKNLLAQGQHIVWPSTIATSTLALNWKLPHQLLALWRTFTSLLIYIHFYTWQQVLL